MYTVELLKEAELDIYNACDWYEQRQVGLAAKFHKELNRYLQLISKNPYLFNVRFSEKFRFANLKTFLYFIVYAIERDSSIVYINSIFHTSKNPQKFQ